MNDTGPTESELVADLRQELTDRNEAIKRQADELVAAGAMIALLVRRLDAYGAISLHLPNEVAPQQLAAFRMLAGAGLDATGRRAKSLLLEQNS